MHLYKPNPQIYRVIKLRLKEGTHPHVCHYLSISYKFSLYICTNEQCIWKSVMERRVAISKSSLMARGIRPTEALSLRIAVPLLEMMLGWLW